MNDRSRREKGKISALVLYSTASKTSRLHSMLRPKKVVLSLDKVVQKKMRWVCTNTFDNACQISSPINNKKKNNSKHYSAAVLQAVG